MSAPMGIPEDNNLSAQQVKFRQLNINEGLSLINQKIS